MKMQHYIINKETEEVEHGPFPSENAANKFAEHTDWFHPDTHEVAAGTNNFSDDTEHSDDTDDYGTHGHFIMHPDCEFPVAGPFDTEELAMDFKPDWLHPENSIVIGMLSSDGNFYPH